MRILALRLANVIPQSCGGRVLSVYPQSRTFSSLKGNPGKVGGITNKITPKPGNSTESLQECMSEMRQQMRMMMSKLEELTKAKEDVMELMKTYITPKQVDEPQESSKNATIAPKQIDEPRESSNKDRIVQPQGNLGEVEETTSKIPLKWRNSTEALQAQMNEKRRQMSMMMTELEGVSKANGDVMSKLEEVSTANEDMMNKLVQLPKANEHVMTKLEQVTKTNISTELLMDWLEWLFFCGCLVVMVLILGGVILSGIYMLYRLFIYVFISQA